MDVAYSASGQLQEALVCGRQDFSVTVTFSFESLYVALFSPKGPTLQLSVILGRNATLAKQKKMGVDLNSFSQWEPWPASSS